MTPQASREKHFDGVSCAVTIQKFPGGVVILKIVGTDTGELGQTPMVELQDFLGNAGPVHLFIDARDVRGASIDVSGKWAEWLRSHKSDFQDISMLTGSRFIHMTAEFVRRFADLQGLMRIYTEAAVFDAVLAEALA